MLLYLTFCGILITLGLCSHDIILYHLLNVAFEVPGMHISLVVQANNFCLLSSILLVQLFKI